MKKPIDRNGASPTQDALTLVEQDVRGILGEHRAHGYAPDRPLMELGLDSLELVQLKGRLEQRWQQSYPNGFLFEHATASRIADAVSRNELDETVSILLAAEEDMQDAGASDPARASGPPNEPVAIVGIACRLPGDADDVEGFWRLLRSGRSAVGRAPDRWTWPSGVELQGRHRGIDRGAFLASIDGFDAGFFRLSPKEARLMDPQHRLALELSWAALEDAGHAPQALAGRPVGVFVGGCHADYRDLVAACGEDSAQVGTGTAPSMLANRVSFFLDLAGPSIYVDTACSSSLVAVDMALRSLRRGECEQALVGGVNLICGPTTTLAYYQAGMLSRGGSCRSFDAAADGYVRGEGGVMMLLKPLSAALRDRDSIYGLVLGTATNHGGLASSLTAPRPSAQAAVVERALREAGVRADSVGYIEAHGTGTPLGDPIEIQGLKLAFERAGAGRPMDPGSCAVGSVKPQIGHLEGAAGIAGMLKAVLCLQRRMLPAACHLDRPNPRLELDGSPFRLLPEEQAFPPPRDGGPRRAGVSSFGFGGANVHAVLEEAPAPPEPGDDAAAVVVLSARTDAALKDAARRLCRALRDQVLDRSARLVDVAFTLQAGRHEFAERVAFAVPDLQALVKVVEHWCATGETGADVFRGGTTAATALPAAAHGQYASLRERGRAWVQRCDVDWSSAWPDDVRRVHLPGYGFERERFWLDRPGAARASRQDSPAMAISMAEAPAPEPAPAPAPASAAQDDLVLPLLASLMHIAAEVLEADPATLGGDAPLSDLGFDSIALTDLVAHVNERFGLALSAAIGYQFPTLQKLAAHLAKQHGQSIAARLVEPAAAAPSGTAPAVAGEPSEQRRDEVGQEPIAIVGLAGRLPGAEDVEALWRLLETGATAISPVPAQRWRWQDVDGDPLHEAGRTDIHVGGFVEGIDEFDSLFFGISPREAQAMDPQQRLLLQHAWKAIEDAGHSPPSLAGTRTGVFVGTVASGYADLLARHGIALEAHSAVATMPSVCANRISYVLDLHGPSEPIETACSSSLVALHRAVVALRRGECDAALVGAVNTLLTPDLHISLAKAGALSRSGLCQTFSAHADGYVRGEGIVMLLLKPLRRAERDGDPIWGLVVGSAVNHGGRALSLTAPQPQAQADVIVQAHREAGTRPAQLGYVEAHGTGTVLGDPIELEGLKIAFSALEEETGERFVPGGCGLASVKSNIGHLEVAAGLAGVAKVLLQMRQEQLVQSLHAEPPNPQLKLSGSPFHIVRSAVTWPAPPGGLPRRAGVSSFSIAGSNAHAVLEEYRLPATCTDVPVLAEGECVVLSARSPASLRAMAVQLLQRLQGNERRQIDLPSLAYTLQVGRAALDERLALVVRSIDELARILHAFAADGSLPEGTCWRGCAPRDRPAATPLSADEDFKALVDRWIQRGRVARLAEAWVGGAEVDWPRLHAGRPVRRLRLPTYAFERVRHWFPQAAAPGLEVAAAHHLTGQESFLADHRVRGQALLPAMAHLALAAQAFLPPRCRFATLRLDDARWQLPVWVDARGMPLRVLIDHGAQRFRIECGLDGPMQTASEGRMTIAPPAEPRVLDLRQWHLDVQAWRLDGEALYPRLAAMGLQYGPSHRWIRQLSAGPRRILARLEWPPGAPMDGAVPVGLFDAAIQAALGITLRDADERAVAPVLALPVALRALQLRAPCKPLMWAAIESLGGADPSADELRFDLRLCDDAGLVCAEMEGLSLRKVRALSAAAPAAGTEQLLAIQWTRVPDDASPRPVLAGTSVLVIGGHAALHAAIESRGAEVVSLPEQWLNASSVAELGERLRQIGPVSQVVWPVAAAPGPIVLDASLVERQDGGVLLGLKLAQAALDAGWNAHAVRWTVVTTQAAQVAEGEAVDPVHAAVHGLFGCLQREQPTWRIVLADLPAGTNFEDAPCLELAGSSTGPLAWREGQWWQRSFVRAARSGMTDAHEPGEVHIVIGGAGGVGQAWSEAVLRRHAVQLVWVGRRAEDDSIRRRLDELAALGPRPLYLQADAARIGELQRVREQVMARFGRIDRLVHAAMQAHDAAIAEVSPEGFHDGLRAKVDTAVSAARAFEDLPLKDIVFFSSIASFVMLPGASAYTAGCCFTDALALQLSRARPTTRVRVANWGFFGGVGAVSADHHWQRMARAGLGSIDIDGAMVAMDELLGGPQQQLAYLRTLQPEGLPGLPMVPSASDEGGGPLAGATVPPADAGMDRVATVMQAVPVGGETLHAAVFAYFRSLASEVLGVQAHHFEESGRPFGKALLAEFGMDSLSATTMRNLARFELQADVGAQELIGERVDALVESVCRLLLLRHLSTAAPESLQADSESFVF